MNRVERFGALRAPKENALRALIIYDPWSSGSTESRRDSLRTNVNRVERFGALRAPKENVLRALTNSNPWPLGSPQSHLDPLIKNVNESSGSARFARKKNALRAPILAIPLPSGCMQSRRGPPPKRVHRIERFRAIHAPKKCRRASRAENAQTRIISYTCLVPRRAAATHPEPLRPTQRTSQIESSVSARFARRTKASALRAPKKKLRASHADD